MINTFSHTERCASFKKRFLTACALLLLVLIVSHCRIVTGLFYCHSVPCTLSSLTELLGVCGVLMLVPQVGKKLYFLFTLLGCSINFVILNTVITFFYYLVFTPIALLLRLAGKNAISLKFSREKGSNWHEHKQVKELKQYLKQY